MKIEVDRAITLKQILKIEVSKNLVVDQSKIIQELTYVVIEQKVTSFY